ncbi:MAG TPA: PKD domain-containing protein, partial [Candidatus Kapabacteria bacterium]|nr:PKD domain-containing protein [Candidatus Kapabacteria bacterium]
MRTPRALVIFLLSVACVFSLAPVTASAQLENNTWYFGYNEGLDFSTNPPTFLTNGSQTCFEGSASISDPTTGKLLFYTDGILVWNRAHRVMPNGNNLSSHWSATQPAVILPDPGDPSKYYIFTADHSGYGGAVRGINYSKVDMTLEGGFGDVTVKNSQLLGWAAEKITAVKICNGSAYWVIAHGYFNSKFYAWRVDKNGVSNPVVSEVGSYHGPALDDGVGWMSASPDGSMLALAFYTRTVNNIELFRFDALSGVVSNGLTIGNAYQPYGITFSPQGKKLYATSVGRIDQYDVTAWDAQTITNSWQPLNSVAQENGAIKIGPDGKLYIQHSAYLGVIAQPELTGILCGYTEAAIRTSPGGKYGLPNNVDASVTIACGPPDAHIRSFPGPICEAECVSFLDSSQFGPTAWQWEFEGAEPATSNVRDPKNVCYPKAGTYKVQLTASNASGSSTDIKYITVQKCDPPDVTLRDTSLCAAKCLTFIDTNSASDTRQWEFEGGTPNAYYGDTPPPICYDSAGVFKVTLIASNPWGSDTAIATVTVNECPWPVARSEHDTVVC